MTQLYDLKNNEEFGMFVLIKSADIRMARNGNPFIAFSFQDRSGSIDGMYWSATEQEIAKYQPGKVAFLRGERDSYQGSPQIKIKALRLADEGEPNDPSLFIERIEVNQDDLEAELKDALFELREPNIARIVRKILHQFETEFYLHPAAKRHHHAMAGGLSFHTITMVQIGRQLLKIYPQLNSSLLIGGIILHDIGKTIELSGAISTEYTLKGKLMGHIVIMDELIDRAAVELGIDPEIEAVLALKHVVLAHHGKLEFGSPVVPQLLEAEVIHHIDNMDATINMMTTALAKVEPGHFSEAIYPLDRRQVYKPKFK
ncbi:3'-5' exoribonuclease YhaM family protein [Vaginisenegalia massiliensis]|uniref:3'-5' exoribonuclease YhaM family protein n=1 Tax=Vaginisenegalia massiliensis TaxID=2058294 RepID=UPI000F524862|nr:HD domain-containing protein [Vaginisenegalia massiliensis]